jgi:integrase
MTITLEGRVAQANGRLKAANVGISIELDGGSLYLRGTLPPRPGAKSLQSCQQRVSLKRLGIRANPAGIAEAEKEARKIAALVARKEFDWQPYLYQKTSGLVSISECVEQYKVYFFNKGGSQTSWTGDYWKILKRFPQDATLTVEVLEQVILSTPPNSKTRKRACMAIAALAKFADLDYNPSHLAGNYSPKRAAIRDLPDDLAIAQWWYKITNPGWRWVYGMIATYGLRPHEVFRLDLEQIRNGSNIVSVLENTKTGARLVWACYPEWFEQFHLQDVKLPNVKLDRANTALGESCSHYFADFKLPFQLYDLRHRWAVRTLEYGLDISLAAQQMGHSVQVHSDIYHHWITEDVHRRAFNALMLRPDRPRPPKLDLDFLPKI